MFIDDKKMSKRGKKRLQTKHYLVKFKSKFKRKELSRNQTVELSEEEVCKSQPNLSSNWYLLTGKAFLDLLSASKMHLSTNPVRSKTPEY